MTSRARAGEKKTNGDQSNNNAVNGNRWKCGVCCIPGCRHADLLLQPELYFCSLCGQVVHVICAEHSGRKFDDGRPKLQCPAGVCRKEGKRAASEESMGHFKETVETTNPCAPSAPKRKRTNQIAQVVNHAISNECPNNSNIDEKSSENGEEDSAETRTTKKLRRNRVSYDDKARILTYMKSTPGVTISSVARNFGIHESTIRMWVKNSESIFQAQSERIGRMKASRHASANSSVMRLIDQAVLDFIELNDKRWGTPDHVVVTGKVVAEKGMEAKQRLLQNHAWKPFLSDNDLETLRKFGASHSWGRKWVKAHNIKSEGPLLAAATELEPLNEVVPQEYQRETLQEKADKYDPDHVFCMMEASLYYKILPNRSYVSRSKTSVRATKSMKPKDRVTLYLCMNESGSLKVPLAVIGQGRPRCFELSEVSGTLPYYHQSRAWSDARTYRIWWRQIFLPSIRKFTSSKVLLILSHSTPHSESEDGLEDSNNQVDVVKLPPIDISDTSVPTSPMEAGILRALKKQYRFTLLQQILEIYDDRHRLRKAADEAKLAASARGLDQGHTPHVGDCMRILKQIWSSSFISDQKIQSCWKRSCVRRHHASDSSDRAATARCSSVETSALLHCDEDLKEFLKDIENTKDMLKDINAVFEYKAAVEDEAELKGDATMCKDWFDTELDGLCTILLDFQGKERTTREVMADLESWYALEERPDIKELVELEIRGERDTAWGFGRPDSMHNDESDDETDSHSEGGNTKESDGDIDWSKQMEAFGERNNPAVELMQIATKLQRCGATYAPAAAAVMEACSFLQSQYRKDKRSRVNRTQMSARQGDSRSFF